MIRCLINAIAWLLIAALIALQWNSETQAQLLWSYHGLLYAAIFACVMFMLNLAVFTGHILREMRELHELEHD